MLNSSKSYKEIFEQALLSRAAYADLVDVSFERGAFYTEKLEQVLPSAAAAYVAENFGVLHHQPNTTYGYSATLFRRREVEAGDPSGGFSLAIRGTEKATLDDLRADLLQILFTGVAWHQRAALQIHWDGLVSGASGFSLDPAVREALAQARINVAGHSLGGHLATWFANDRPDALGHAFTFNAPGVVYADRSGIPANRISSFVSDAYPDVIAGIHTVYGSADRFFIESGLDAGIMAGHSMSNLLMGIASTYLLSLLDPTLGDSDIRDILRSAAHDGTQSYEEFARILRQSYGLDAPAAEMEGDATIFGLIGQFENGSLAAGHVIALGSLTAAELAARAAANGEEGTVLRHALVNALPFAVIGTGTPDRTAAYAAESFSPEYLLARSEYLLQVAARNREDVAIPSSIEPHVMYIDRGTDMVLASPYGNGQFAPREQVIFGTNGADGLAALSGATGNDRIFGGDGDDQLDGRDGSDVLDGGAGNDVLRSGAGAHDTLLGGSGHDLYVIDVNARRVTLHDSDGLGTVTVERAEGSHLLLGRNMLAIPGQVRAAEDESGNRYVLAGEDLHVTLVDGRTLTIRGYNGNELGIELPEAADVTPPAAPVTEAFIVTPGNPDGRIGTTRLRYVAGVPEYVSPYAAHHYAGGNAGSALSPEVIDVSQAPSEGFSSVAVIGGLGDSHLIGGEHRDVLVDDYNMTAVNGTFWFSGDRPGNDVLLGGGGNDVLETHGGDDESHGGEGDDLLVDYPVHYSGSPATGDIEWALAPGHTNRDRLYGEAGNDVLVASAGNAYLDGGDGNDELYGGAHDDVLTGGAGDDLLSGDSRPMGRLWLYGYPWGIDLTVDLAGRIVEETIAPGNDHLDGGDGNDHLLGGGGADMLLGGAGNDVLQGDTLFLPAGARAMSANHGLTPLAFQGNDRLFGGEGDDWLYGGGGDDELDGGEGNDRFYGGAGDDAVIAGAGADYIVGDDADGSQGRDELHGGDGDDTLFGMGGNDRLYGGAGTDTLVGGSGDDVLEGGEGDDYSATGSAGLYGEAGNDILRGGPGRDRLQGGDGDDRLEADSGSDLLFGDAGNDVFVLSRGAGTVQITDTAGTNRILFGSGIAAADVSVSMSGGLVHVRYSSADSAVMSAATFATLEGFDFPSEESLDVTGIRQRFQPGVLGSDRSVWLGAGVQYGDVALRRWNDDLLLVYEGNVADWVNTDNLTARNVMFSLEQGERYGLSVGSRVLALDNWYLTDAGTYVNRFRSRSGNSLGFTDQADVAPGIFTGTPRAEIVAGSENPDTLSGGGGNDILAGGQGDDVYVYHRGDGQDIFVDHGGHDLVRFGPDISVDDLIVREGPEGLTITFGQGQGSLLFAGWARGGGASIDGVMFADGSQLDRAGLDALNAGNHSPRAMQTLPDRAVQPDQPFSITLPAGLFADADTDVLDYSVAVAEGVALPSWLTFDPASRTLSGLPGIADAGTTRLAVTATDSGGLSAQATLALTVVVPIRAEGTAQNDWIVIDPSTRSHHVLGYEGNDFLWGGSGADILDGGPGNDHVVGNGGDDIVMGGDGNDNLGGDSGWGAVGNDRVYGGPGDDRLEGGPGVDLLFGEDGNDTLYGTSSTFVGDTLVLGGGSAMYGGPGDDLYYVRSPLDTVIEHAGEGYDSVGSENDYALGEHVERLYLLNGSGTTGIGNELANELHGNGLDNMLIGAGGNDLLNGAAGADLMDGGDGDDTYFVDATGDRIVDSSGIDTVHAAVSFALTAELENLVLIGSAGLTGTGNALDNVLTGNGRGSTLAGGAGNDRYLLANAADIVSELADEGIDTIESPVSHSLGANVENLVLTGNGHVSGAGNALPNRIIGNAGANRLNGGAGADFLQGGFGDDTYVVDDAGDVVVEAADAGTDVVESSITYVLGGHVEQLTLTGTAAIDGTGNPLDNVLNGNSAANVLDGAGGADTLRGGAGDDTYVVDDANDVVLESANQGTDTIRSWLDWTLGSHVEQLTLLGAAPLSGTGNSSANTLTGNGAANVLDGGGGADLLVGGAGDDTLIGGTGNDTLQGGTGNDLYYVDAAGDVTVEKAGEGIDAVHSTVTRTLADHIEILFLGGTNAINGTGTSLDNLVRGNAAANRLAGGNGVDILEGGAGNDVLSDTSGRTLLSGGAGNDTLTGGSGNDLLVGGRGNDTIATGTGADIILFNRGDGQDTVAASTTRDNTLSLGGGIAYADLRFQRNGSNLLLLLGGGDQITFTGYFSNAANRSIDRLQIVIDGGPDHLPGSTDPLRNRRVETFDFDGLVAAFNTARSANPGLTWSPGSALVQQRSSGSDTAAMGGDLAYRYAMTGTLGDLAFTPALGLLNAAGFGTAAQALQPLSGLQDHSPRLM